MAEVGTHFRALSAVAALHSDLDAFTWLDGTEAVLERFLPAYDSAREILSLHNGEAYASEQDALDALAATDRILTAGGRVRDVYARPMWMHRHYVQEALLGEVELGSLLRRGAAPTRLTVFDRQVLFLARDPEDVGAGALVTRDPQIVDLAMRLFSASWQGAADFLRIDRIRSREADVLRRLSEGHTDARIARDLGVSERTVSRIITSLHKELGATSRFQLAIKAQRAGLLG